MSTDVLFFSRFCFVFPITKLKNNVLIKRDDGGPTYFATDIAYHQNKFFTRDFDTVIDIWGADHHGHIKRLSDALKALGIDTNNFVVILMGVILS